MYTTELMTGYVSEDGVAPMSILTVRSLIDLGYSVDETKAEPFEVDEDIADEYDVKAAATHPRLRGSKSATDHRIQYGDDIAKFPVVQLTEVPRKLPE